MRIVVVGDEGVGKTSFVTALGADVVAGEHTMNDEESRATTGGNNNSGCRRGGRNEPCRYRWLSPHSGYVPIRIWRQKADIMTAQPNDVFILLFDLTRKDSFAAVIAQWSSLMERETHVLLVGNKVDRPREREVFTAEAMELAVIDFDEYVEVSSTEPPFDGIAQIRAKLSQWAEETIMISDNSTTVEICEHLSPPPAPKALEPHHLQSSGVFSSPSTSPSPQKPMMRASIWLYDPTEEAYTAQDDIKLRPISKALYEIRDAGSDKAKVAVRQRDRVVSRGVMRSQYYGPTESSRQKRWEEEQKKKKQRRQQNLHFCVDTRQRSMSQPEPFTWMKSKASHKEDSTRSANKSFMQTTELLRYRRIELDEKKHAHGKMKVNRKAGFDRSVSMPEKGSQSEKLNGHGRRKESSASIDSMWNHVTPCTSESTISLKEFESLSIKPSHRERRPNFAVDIKVSTSVTDGEQDDSLHFDLLSPRIKHVRPQTSPLSTARLHSPVPSIVNPPSPYCSSADSSDAEDYAPVAAINLQSECSSRNELKVDVFNTCTDLDQIPTNAVKWNTLYPQIEDSSLRNHNDCKVEEETEEFDSTDIDKMLDYFDGVTLPI